MEIFLYGIVGDGEAGLDAATLVPLIDSATDDITVRINSAGGLIFDGIAILTALQASPQRVICQIDGVAASMASVIAMVGDEVLIAENAMIMIHNPMDGTFGDAAELRKAADTLDKMKEQLVGIYAARTGLSPDELWPMLDAETWLNAEEALAAGFVTGISVAMRMAACLDVSKFGFRKVPDHPLFAPVATSPPAPAAILPTPENPMPDLIVPAPTPTPTPAPTPAPVNVATEIATALEAERARQSTIVNEVTRAHLGREFADTLVNEGVSIDVARTRIIDQIATAAPSITNYRPATIPSEQFAARAVAMSEAIANRANPRNTLTDGSRPFAGQRLIVLARNWLESTGVNARNMTDVEVAQAVYRYRQPLNAGQHTTSDFPSIMGNTVGRTLRRAYELAPQTFKPFCRQSSVPDFRPVSRVALSDISPMQPVAEGAEYQYATIGDSAEQYVVGKWGQIISLTWETIINDDLDAFDRLPMAMGQEAAQVESDVIWAIMLGNPNMSDGTALFNANHGNLAAAGADIGIASLQAGRTRMRTQKAPKGRFLNTTPSFLLVGPLKEQVANQFTSANYVATKNSDINPEYNRSLTPIVEPRITDTTWFLSADPNAQAVDTIEYAYLAGHEGVQIEQRTGFEVDGQDIKAKLVFGGKAIDWRAMDKNPGA